MNTDTLKPASVEQRLFIRPGLASRALKRAFDILMAGLGLICLSPVFGLLAILIRRDSPGPVFYRGRRLGRKCKPFGILKFRTMREEPASYAGPRLTASGDARITPLGQWLRNTKLNELPQLWNVLVGQMSLVGPRPEDPEIAADWPPDARREILSVRPGITSPASVTYHDEEQRLTQDNLMGDYLGHIAPDKLRLDRLYVRHRTFMTDLDAIFWTLIALVPRLAHQPDSEGLLFGGPFTRLLLPYLNWTVIDFSVSMLAAGLVGLVWRTFQPLNLGWDWALLLALAFSMLFGLVNSLLGLTRIEWSRAASHDIVGLFISCGVVTAICALLDSFVPILNVPEGFIFAASQTAALGFVVARYRLRLVTGLASRWVRARGYGVGERVLVVGAGAGGEIATWLLRRPDFQHLFRVVGFVDDAASRQGMRYDGIPVLGTSADIPALVEKEDIGLVLFSIGKISTQNRERILGSCQRSGARVVNLSDVLHSLEGHFIPDTLRSPKMEQVNV